MGRTVWPPPPHTGRDRGCYLLGRGTTAGGALDPDSGNLLLRKNFGGVIWYQHYWSSKLRPTSAIGKARAQPFGWESGDTFKNTIYAYGNFMWSVLPYVNLGFEYDYGLRSQKDGSNKDNHRVMLGMQIF